MNKKLPPLRKIVRRVQVQIAEMYGKPLMTMKEELECGHIVSEKQDIYGRTNAERRRCWRCLKEASEPGTPTTKETPRPHAKDGTVKTLREWCQG